MDQVKVQLGREVVSFDDERFKSDLADSTSLSKEKINDVTKKTKEKLSGLIQPVTPNDIATTAYLTLTEMSLKNEGDKYMAFLHEVSDDRLLKMVTVRYIDCRFCGASNPRENEKCISCGASLNKE